MTPPRVVPAPAEQCGYALLLLAASWLVAGVAAFVVGTAIAKRWRP